MLGILITLVILCLILGLIWWACDMLPIPAPLKMIIHVAIVLVAVIYLIGLLTGGVSLPRLAL